MDQVDTLMRSAERKESEVRSQKSEYGREYVVFVFFISSVDP